MVHCLEIGHLILSVTHFFATTGYSVTRFFNFQRISSLKIGGTFDTVWL